MGLVFGEGKGRDMLAIGRNLTDMALTVEFESSNPQNILLR